MTNPTVDLFGAELAGKLQGALAGRLARDSKAFKSLKSQRVINYQIRRHGVKREDAKKFERGYKEGWDFGWHYKDNVRHKD